MANVALSIGTNSENRHAFIEAMERALESILEEPVKSSELMETEAVDVQGTQPAYLNRVITGVFSGTPGELLRICEEVELSLGREGKGLKSIRTADIDILLYDDVVISSEELTIPHRAILQRRFVIEGLYQLCPDYTMPCIGKTVREIFLEMSATIKKQDIRFPEKY